MVRKVGRGPGRPPKKLDVAEKAVGLLHRTGLPLSDRAIWRELKPYYRTLSKNTVSAALKWAATVLPEDWNRFGAEAPYYQGRYDHSGRIAGEGEGVVRYNPILHARYHFGEEEAIKGLAQVLVQARRPSETSTLGEAITGGFVMSDWARLRVHCAEDLRRAHPEWDRMTRLEKLNVSWQVEPVHEEIVEPTVAGRVLRFIRKTIGGAQDGGGTQENGR